MNRIILALDTTDLDKAISIGIKSLNKIFTIKLGLEFFNAHGKDGIKKFNEIGITNLMLDLKLKDIPQTVYRAIKALDGVKFGFLTIHGLGGKKMIEEAKKAAAELNFKPKIMMVTVLTALNDQDLKSMGNSNSVIKQVEQLALMAKELNVGVVCSGQEAKIVKKIIGPSLQVFSPGIRMINEKSNDQKRTCTPLESITNGSDKIIMGRSLINGNLEENIKKVVTSITN